MKRIILILITTLSFIGCKFEKQYVKESREMWNAYFQITLKDPSSLTIYKEEYKDISHGVVEWTIDYGAKNSFGGMNRKTIEFKTLNDILFVGDYGTYKKSDLGLE